MSVALNDDLRQAVQSAGTPLRVVDPITGEAYVLVSESVFEELSRDDMALQQAQISNARLLELASDNRPPKEWLDREEDVF